LHQVCELETPDPDASKGWLGVDVGIVNLAVTSDGEVFSGEQLEARRQWYTQRRARLQSVGTKSAKRRLRQLSGKQSRFQKDVNHCISRALVETAQRTGRGIALEDLSGIRSRTRVRRGQRNRHHNWPCYQLRQFVSYKSEMYGVPIQLVDPLHTSQACSVCGHSAKFNRVSRDNFMCSACGHAAPADLNAAINIAARAAVNRPMVSTEVTKDSVNCVTVLSQGQTIPL
jgi:IS605 OrfB family transposase